VFQSGFVLHPYHPDKAAPCLEMLRLDPAKKVWFYDGFSSADTYTGLLGRSKACYTFVRHSGAMPTRGLEALSMGTAVVVQKGGNLGLYFGEDEGVLEYGPEPGSLEAALGRIADNWPDFQKRAYKGALKVRRDFRLPLVADQYFRFLTVLAARPRGPRQKADRSGLYQKRMVMARGWLPGGPQLLHALMRDRLDRLEKRLNQEPSSRLFIDLTRELVLDYAGTLAHIRDFEPGYPPPVHQLLDLALNLFTSGVNQFPRSLPLRFNLIRTVLHLGRPDMVTNALAFARQTLEAPFHHWAVDVLEDVFPWDCYSGFFNYRKYFDRVTFHLSRGVQVGPDLTRLILASLHHYLSFYANPVEHASKAVSLDRDFAPYRLRLARIMIERAGVVDQKRAKGVENHVVLNTGKTVDDMLMAERLLHELARDSILFPEAADLLEQLASENRTTQPISDSIRLAAARYRASVDDIQRSGLRLRKADWRDGSQPGPAASLDQVEYRHRLAVKAGEGEG
jgi:hypothetical protein